ncbi:hypothetical protein R3W88_030494 [Solanum pinnatisectum]|uniref:DNA-directed RNA polymerase n=1 Tax=Solanum pinnatisectum TaxID=50273 RepID=A0AAV9K8I2_9SOLN|nr:hypothetical protein R3W88_030494 [Solanum pinnatisectum]
MIVILHSCDLVELRKVVGSIARQSIGESGTHLTLKTSHICGVFTGRTGEHVWASSNEKIKFNEDLIHPTHTCHGHPAFSLKSIIYNVDIPSKILLLVQNDQYVESVQVIAEKKMSDEKLFSCSILLFSLRIPRPFSCKFLSMNFKLVSPYLFHLLSPDENPLPFGLNILYVHT